MINKKENDALLIIEKVLLLKSLSIFEGTPEPILAEVAALMREKETDNGVDIFREGDFGNCMYIIYRGEIRIHKAGKTVAVLHERNFFGELSLLDAETRSATATANSDCYLYVIEQEPFYELLEMRPDVARGIIKILCNRLRSALTRE